MNHEPGPYVALFPKGSSVRIESREALDDFAKTWRFHHPLLPEQLAYADFLTTVGSVGFYHGGDQLYILVGVPGIWHPECLREP